jgi:hypothetical protein
MIGPQALGASAPAQKADELMDQLTDQPAMTKNKGDAHA